MNLQKKLKKYEDEKKQLWYENNCLNEENFEFITKVLLSPFKKITNVKEIIDCGETALTLEYNTKVYKIEVNKEFSCLILSVRKQNVSYKISKYNPKSKEYYSTIDHAGDGGCFFGTDPWVDVINWIIKKE